MVGWRNSAPKRLLLSLYREAIAGRPLQRGYRFKELRSLAGTKSNLTVQRAAERLMQEGLLTRRKEPGRAPRYFFRRNQVMRCLERAVQQEPAVRRRLGMIVKGSPLGYRRSVSVAGRKLSNRAWRVLLAKAEPIFRDADLRDCVVVIDVKERRSRPVEVYGMPAYLRPARPTELSPEEVEALLSDRELQPVSRASPPRKPKKPAKPTAAITRAT